MNYKQRGRAIIFNHYKFQTLNSRDGTDLDEKNLKKRLSALNFDIKVHRDLKYMEIYQTLQTAAEDKHEDVGCLMIIVLTHGESNGLHAYDHMYSVDTLWTPFVGNKCPSLVGKPKIFLIQVTIFYFVGYYSWRSPLNGSWFIECLCKELEKHASERDFLTILTFVNRRMAIDYESNVPDVAYMHKKKQIGSIMTTLTRLLYFYEHNLILEEGTE
ncbi:caspase-1-like [Agrilus planipennis]|uniref:Caspase-1-like n=1 Tax=Agrilus planipennis TaxID=224129 RepID=A0A7F5RIN3_AGRPL|nr:caspase-1-like [Agrilus planipennis]